MNASNEAFLHLRHSQPLEFLKGEMIRIASSGATPKGVFQRTKSARAA